MIGMVSCRSYAPRSAWQSPFARLASVAFGSATRGFPRMSVLSSSGAEQFAESIAGEPSGGATMPIAAGSETSLVPWPETADWNAATVS